MRRLLLIMAAILAALYLASSASARPPAWWVGDAMCVHGHEGSWTDPNAPYFGGMQMDWTFMSNYGGWILAHHGTAEHWPVRTQLLVAWRGWKRQGWYAWPNTARMCGLI